MVDYSKSKIYKIVGGNKTYIGSTVLDLQYRFTSHTCGYRLWKQQKTNFTSSFLLFDEVGVENCSIELIEEFPCHSRKELNKREGECMELVECVNKQKAGRTKKEYHTHNIDKEKEDKKRYYLLNKDKFKTYSKEYYSKKKEKNNISS
jgi:hypothetical protein